MRDYFCFYERQLLTIPARTIFEAQCLAAKRLQLQESKRHLIAVRRTLKPLLGETP